MQTVLIVVIMVMVKSSIFPEGSDWTTMSPFSAVPIGIHLALLRFIAQISVSAVKEAVPLLSCLLALACLLLRLSIETVWAFVRVGSCLVLSASTVSLLFTAGCLPVSWTSVKEIPVQSLWLVRI